MTPVLYILIGLLGGAFLLGIVVAVVVFFKYAKELKTSLDELRLVLKNLSKDNTLAESLGAFRELVNTGNAMMRKMDSLNTTIDLFYKVALRADQMINREAAAPAVPGESEVYAYDEEQAAQREAQRKLRQSGVQMPPDKEIPSEKAVGAQV